MAKLIPGIGVLFIAWKLFDWWGWVGAAIGVVLVVATLILDWAALFEGNASEDGASSDDGPVRSERAVPILATLKLNYVDASGEETERIVIARLYDPDRASISGHCKLRNATRDFRLDRIKAATDMDTGEILQVSRMRSWLRKQRTDRD